MPTKRGPLHLVSHGMAVEELHEKQLWSSCPAFLQSEEKKWPRREKLIVTSEAGKEVRKSKLKKNDITSQEVME